MTDQYWMKQAYEKALEAQSKGEVPVGAVFVDDNNQLVAASHNTSRSQYDPTAHAEVNVIRAAGNIINNHRLNGGTLYVTLEPCVMCAGAIVQARINRLVFAARDPIAGGAGSVYNLLSGYPLNHSVQVDEGIHEGPCSAVLKQFFQSRR